MSDIQGRIAGDQTYELISSYGIYDRDIHQRLFKKVPRAGALSWMRALEGRLNKRKARRHVYDFYEEGQWFKASITIAAKSNTGTAAVILTLSSGDHQESGTESYPVVTQQVVFEDETVGYVSAKSTSVDGAHTVTVDIMNASQVVRTAAVVGGTVTFFSNVQKERSTATTGRVPKVTKITNTIQTFRDKFEVSDWEGQNDVEFMYKGSKKLYVKGIDDTADSFAIQEELGMLIGKASDATFHTDYDNRKSIKGLLPQITDSGNTMEYFDAPDMTTFDDAILILNKAFGDHEYIVGQGLNVNLGLKNWLVDFAQAGTGNISFSGLGTSSEQAIKLNFKSVYIEPYSFHFQTWDILSHSDSLGAGNMPYKHMLIFIPTGKTKNPNKQDGENEYEPYLQCAYSDPGGAPNENMGDYKLWETGANARNGATSDELTREIHFASYKGLEVRCRNRFLLGRKAA